MEKLKDKRTLKLVSETILEKYPNFSHLAKIHRTSNTVLCDANKNIFDINIDNLTFDITEIPKTSATIKTIF